MPLSSLKKWFYLSACSAKGEEAEVAAASSSPVLGEGGNGFQPSVLGSPPVLFQQTSVFPSLVWGFCSGVVCGFQGNLSSSKVCQVSR